MPYSLDCRRERDSRPFVGENKNDESVTKKSVTDDVTQKNVTKSGSGPEAPQPPTYADVVRNTKGKLKVKFESEREPLVPLTLKK